MVSSAVADVEASVKRGTAAGETFLIDSYVRQFQNGRLGNQLYYMGKKYPENAPKIHS
jgi:hypothetical protein